MMATANEDVKKTLEYLGNRDNVVEEWQNNDKSEWYRVYASGFIEQGITKKTSAGEIRVTLNKAMKTNVYTVAVGREITSDGRWDADSVSNKTTTGFKYSPVVWSKPMFYVCGY